MCLAGKMEEGRDPYRKLRSLCGEIHGDPVVARILRRLGTARNAGHLVAAPCNRTTERSSHESGGARHDCALSHRWLARAAAIVPTAPAIANAVFDAVGVRIRHVPLTRSRLIAALSSDERSQPQAGGR
jgi:hypothetical protein